MKKKITYSVYGRNVPYFIFWLFCKWYWPGEKVEL